eukprot:m.52692 g.52692  ORF g.52692 m.52692 type:complete len:187 (-) comp10811_c0_seq1:1179-1739(-)
MAKRTKGIPSHIVQALHAPWQCKNTSIIPPCVHLNDATLNKCAMCQQVRTIEGMWASPPPAMHAQPAMMAQPGNQGIIYQAQTPVILHPAGNQPMHHNSITSVHSNGGGGNYGFTQQNHGYSQVVHNPQGRSQHPGHHMPYDQLHATTASVDETTDDGGYDNRLGDNYGPGDRWAAGTESSFRTNM